MSAGLATELLLRPFNNVIFSFDVIQGDDNVEEYGVKGGSLQGDDLINCLTSSMQFRSNKLRSKVSRRMTTGETIA